MAALKPIRLVGKFVPMLKWNTRKVSDVIESNIFESVHNINLRKVIGYHKDEDSYNFLDDYDSERTTEKGEQ